MNKEEIKLALEVLKAAYVPADLDEQRERVITAFEAELAKPDFWEGYVPEPSAGTQVSKVWWDGEKLMAKPIPLKDFYEPAQQEPVAAECNFVGTKEWGRCSIEHHNLVQSEPHNWPGYQTRLLYTSPQPAQQEPAFHGFMDEETCCVNICYTPWAPGGPNNELPTAYYTSPPAQRTWVGLTFAEICECENDYLHIFARAIEAKLKEKNT